MKHIPNPKKEPTSLGRHKIKMKRLEKSIEKRRNMSKEVPNVPAKGKQGGMYKGRYV